MFFLAVLLFLGSVPSSNNNSVDIDEKALRTREAQVIKTLFDNVEPKELENEKFGVIIPYDGNTIFLTFQQAYLLIWFKYNDDSQYITLNYFSFPAYENFNDQVIDRKNNNQIYRRFFNFLLQIIENKKIANMEGAKQLRISIPIGLQNDDLFNKMHKIDPYKPTIEEYARMGIAEKDIHKFSITKIREGRTYNWGFKSNEIEYIRNDDSYYGSFYMQIIKEILSPIIMAILEHETPKGWEDDYKKYVEGRSRKHMEPLNKQSNGN